MYLGLVRLGFVPSSLVNVLIFGPLDHVQLYRIERESAILGVLPSPKFVMLLFWSTHLLICGTLYFQINYTVIKAL